MNVRQAFWLMSKSVDENASQMFLRRAPHTRIYAAEIEPDFPFKNTNKIKNTTRKYVDCKSLMNFSAL